MNNRFNPKKINKLNDPGRLRMIPPEYIWNLMNPDTHTDMVEIGAGTGAFSRAFQRLSGTGRTLAIDVADEMIDWMLENLSNDYPDIIPMKTDGRKLPLDDISADVIFMITVHHELDDQAGMLRESRRILRDTGRICIVDWSPRELSMGGPRAEIRSEPAEVAAQLTEAGFKKPVIDETLKGFFIVIAEG